MVKWWAGTDLLSVIIVLLFLEFSIRGNVYSVVFDLSSLCVMVWGFIHGVACVSNVFLLNCRSVIHCIDKAQFVCSPVEYFGYFHFISFHFQLICYE